MTTRSPQGPAQPPELALVRNKIRQAVGINQQQAVIGDGSGTVRIVEDPGHVWVRVQQGNGLSLPIKALANAAMSYYEGANCYVANLGVQLAVVRPILDNDQTPLVWNFIDSDLNIGSAASSFDIQNITQSYDEWRMTAVLRGDTAAAFVQVLTRLNGNSTAGNYASQRLFSNGTAITASRDTTNATITNAFASAGTSLASAFTTLVMNFSHVIDTGKLTVCSANWNYLGATLGTIQNEQGHGMFALTSAINRIQIIPSAGNWAAGSGWLLEGKVL